jgi:ribonuclease P/MRP protein subunit RPP40
MVSGLKGRTYEERLEELNMVTLEERRHQTDMTQVYKIVNGLDNVNKECWFTMLNNSDRVTRATADPLNIRGAVCRLEIRRNFFSQRVTDAWNNVPRDLKCAKSVSAFRKGYQSLRRTRQPYGEG